jgi:tRNA pseudouridine38-40 synthase
MALNSLLPKDIYVKSVEEVSDKFNSRFDAKEKTYLYKI